MDRPTPPSSPPGDFFGLGLGQYIVYESGPLTMGRRRGAEGAQRLLPHALPEGAVITVTNEGDLPTASLPYNIDWEKHTSLPADLGYFHAHYRQATPFPGWTTDWSPPSPSSATLTR